MSGNSKTLGSRIRAVKNTQKVTRSMKLMATIRLKSFIKLIENSKLYDENLIKFLSKVLDELSVKNQENLLNLENLSLLNNNNNNFNNKNNNNSIGLLLFSSDTGLCGNYNIQVFKYFEKKLEEFKNLNKNIKLILVGKKAKKYITRFHPKLEIIKFIENSDFERENINLTLEREFINNNLLEIHVIYAKFISSIKFEPVISKLLPIDIYSIYNPEYKSENKIKELEIFEPSLRELAEKILSLYTKSRLERFLHSSRASEVSTRANAMTSATDNAEKLINNLTLKFNKERQASITQEISEIVVGMESL